MKKLYGITVVLAIIVLNACNLNGESKIEKSEESNFDVCAIHEIEIKADVDLKEFETFVLKEIAPIYNKMKGQTFILVKGDRGLRTAKYAVILTFESLEDRNRIYPPSGEFVGDFGSDALWEKFDSMLVAGIGEAFTDYVKVVH